MKELEKDQEGKSEWEMRKNNLFKLLTDFSKSERMLIPEGNYEALISEAVVREFSTGNSGITVTLSIRDDVDQFCTERIINDNLVLTEKAIYKFHLLSDALGVQIDEQMTLEKFAQLIPGKPVRITVVHHQYNGRTWERVSQYERGLELNYEENHDIVDCNITGEEDINHQDVSDISILDEQEEDLQREIKEALMRRKQQRGNLQ